MFSEGMRTVNENTFLRDGNTNPSKLWTISDFDPAPDANTRKKRRKYESPAEQSVVSPDEPESPAVYVDAFGSLARSGVPSPVWRTKGSLKAQKPAEKLQSQNQHSPSSNVDALSLKVVQDLVMAINKNKKLKVGDIVRDIQQKLEMVRNMDEGQDPLRNIEKYSSGADKTKTKKMKPKNILKEMDKILDNFLNEQRNSSMFDDSSSAEPRMRVQDRANDEDLMYELDGGDLHVPWRN